MGNVVGGFWADPVKTMGLTLLAFAVFFALVGVTALIFRSFGRERALGLGLMVSQRNMGLMVAATDGILPGTTWLYFALSQFPIYLSPQLLKPLVTRLSAQQAISAATAAAASQPRSARAETGD
jgi:BASS family bile acid:Na+ symporter